MRFCLTPIVLTLALVLAACEPAPQEVAVPAAPSQAEVEAALNSLDEAFASAFNAGDAAAAAALYADDAVLMPPNAPAVTGKEAIQSFWKSGFDQFAGELSLTPAEVEVADDWAFSRGTYAGKSTPKAGGKPIEDTGNGLTIYKRQPDGSWKFARDIWNSDKPLPGTGQQ